MWKKKKAKDPGAHFFPPVWPRWTRKPLFIWKWSTPSPLLQQILCLPLQILSVLWDWGPKEKTSEGKPLACIFLMFNMLYPCPSTQHSILPSGLLVRKMRKGKYSRYYLSPVLPPVIVLCYYNEMCFSQMLILQVLVLPASTHYILTISEEEYLVWTPSEPRNCAQYGKSVSVPCVFMHMYAHPCIR